MFWYQGKLIEGDSIQLNIADPALLYGATVFTTVRVYQQSLDRPLTHWTAHCDRLRQSLESLGWQLPNWQRIRQGAERLSIYYPILRITLFADGREWISGRDLPKDLAQKQDQGAVGWMATEPLFQRTLPGHKTGNYLGAWLALQKAQKLGANEAILIDGRGNWLETSTGNLWGWKQGCWFTPALGVGILPGIARSQLLHWLKTQGIPVEQNHWNPEFVRGLEIIAYSNCAVEIIPFSRIINLEKAVSLHLYHPVINQLKGYFELSN